MKRGLLIALFLLIIPSTLAATGISGLDNAWRTVISLGNLSFLGFPDASLVHGFLRILMGILVFTIFFALLTSLKQTKFFNRGQSGVVAGILAITTAIFLPAELLTGIGAGYATAVSAILIGIPVLGTFYLLFQLPSKDRLDVFLKIVALLILLWVLLVMKYHVARLV